jgi:hypothetical protein
MQIVRGKRQVVLWASIAIVAVLAWIVFVEVNKSPYNTSRDDFVRKGPNSADIAHYGGLDDTPRFRLRKAITVTDSVELSKLVDELNALPPAPTGTMYCPLDDGSYYLIVVRYLNGGDITIKATSGCEVVYLVPSNRAVAWAATTPGFYPLLAGLLGE